MRAIDRTVNSLCAEIDDLVEAVEYYKSLYEAERDKNSRMLHENLKASQRDLGNALLFFMSVSDNENGDLVIDAGSRKILSEKFNNKNQ